jgi:hypothetical protein
MAEENTANAQANNAPEENITNTPASDVAEVVPQAAEITQQAEHADGDKNVPAAAPVTNPANPTPPSPGAIQNFQQPHHHFKWHVDVRVDGHDVYQGFIKEITLEGTHLFVEHNLQNAKFVKLHIHIPPVAHATPHPVVEVSGNIISTIFDSTEDCFRSAIHFKEFTLESDRIYLQSRLSA